MVWLVAHMWFLLICAFVLGIGLGWWIWGTQIIKSTSSNHTAPDHVSIVEQGSLSEDETPVTRNGQKRFKSAKNGDKDDLTQIIGLDEDTQKTLNRLGVMHLYQIADWGPARIKWIEDKIGEDGRIERERWVSQARTLRLQNEYETP